MINDKPSFAFLEIFARHGPTLESQEANNTLGTGTLGYFLVWVTQRTPLASRSRYSFVDMVEL